MKVLAVDVSKSANFESDILVDDIEFAPEKRPKYQVFKMTSFPMIYTAEIY